MKAAAQVRILISGVLVADAAIVGWQHQANEHLRQRRDALVQRVRALGPARLQQRELQLRLAAMTTDTGAAQTDERASVPSSRTEPQSDRGAIEQPALAYDPEKGLASLAQLRDVGRGTPAATLQTLLWALDTGHEDGAAASLWLDPEQKSEGEAWLRSLPAETQAHYRTPEHILTLFLASDLLRKINSIRIVDTRLTGLNDAVVRVRTATQNGAVSEQKFPLRLSAGGWQVVMSPGTIARIRQLMARETKR